jgi:post-segregation antitoxin (ccd killing protein)
VASVRTTFTLEEELAQQARELGVNVSAAARQGVADAVRAALAEADREAYARLPEHPADDWSEVEAWGAE